MAGEEQTIIARFIADVTGFTQGAQEVVNQSEAIERATSGISGATQSAASNIVSVGTAGGQASKQMEQAAQTFSAAGGASEKAGKSMEETAGGMAAVGGASEKAAKGASDVSESMGTASEHTSKMRDAVDGAASGMEGAGKEASAAGAGFNQAGKDADASGEGMRKIEESSGKAGKEMADAGNLAEGAGKSAKNAAGGFDMMEVAMKALIAIQIVQMFASIIQAADKINQDLKDSTMAFTYLTGSAQKADQELKNLNNTFAAKAWGSKVIDDAAQSLRMMGKSAEDTQKEIERVSDALAAMGQDGSKLKPATQAMEDINKQTIVTKEDIQKLQDTGVDAYQALAEGLSAQRGKTIDVAEAQKEVNAGAIHGKEAYQALLTGMQQYSGAAEEKAKTLSATWQQFAETAAPLLVPFIQELTKLLTAINSIIDAVKQMKQALDSIGGGGIGSSFMSGMYSTLNPASGIAGTINALNGYAAGGTNLPQGWRVVGEDGPELQWSPGGDTIVPSGMDPMTFIGSSGGGGSALSMPSLSFGGGAPQTVELSIYMDTVAIARQTIPLIAPQIRVLAARRS
ncbi:hypothetical protein KSF_096020 [Reticulibacter mediterranei]|uniref:Uncharacterized protein n=1 Tax=Reticulibacter mediterranei TaxID=2778369 RepID=A0A8J3IPJ9_9CHLR|nr:tape measure protein [Reticulibacter mediterranei]GHO99554.1 hypothetical protein KSF_096020 [Reticulibacter mediterranei]